MATTADDWTWIKSLIAITEEGNISVDLVAQTLENLNIAISSIPTTDVDIVGQTGGNVDVDVKASTTINTDITAQTLEKLNVDVLSAPTTDVDIIGQTGGNLDIDIKNSVRIATDIVAQTLENLKIDIVASTIGNIPMNINEQGAGDILINLNAQNIDRILIREHEGGAESSSSSPANISAGTSHIFHTVNGKGALMWVYYTANTHEDSQMFAPRLRVDNVLLYPHDQFSQMEIYGFSKTSTPFQLMKHLVDGICYGGFYFPNGLLFDTKLELMGYNHSADQTLNVDCNWFYRKI